MADRDKEVVTIELTREEAHSLAFKVLPIAVANDYERNRIWDAVLKIEIALFPDKER